MKSDRATGVGDRAWTFRRLDKLPDQATTREVRDALQLDERTIRRWAADPFCQRARVVSKHGRVLVWNRDALKLWVIAVAKTKKQRLDGRNPPNPSRQEARNALRLPDDHRVRDGR